MADVLELTVGAAAGDAAEFTALGSIAPGPTVTFEPVGAWFTSQMASDVVEADDGEAVEEDTALDGSKIECPDQNKFDCDPSNWRSQDHYALLGCKNLGYPTYKVPVELIHLAFRKQTMWNHPDKKSRGDWTDEDREAADGFFTCIKKAYETLSSETDRRLFDSVDVPDGYDEIPKETKDAAKFWRDYPSAFTRNARWLKEDPPPVGGEDATEDEVNALYEFWYSAETWREFGYHEEQPADNDSRDQKRYVEKKNKAARKKKQKEERARLLQFLDNAYASDPRIKKFRKAKKDAKLAQEQAVKEKAEREKREAEIAAALEAERKEAEEKAQREAGKNNKEMAKRAKRGFMKTLKRLELIQVDDGAVPEGGVTTAHAEKMKDTLSTERLRSMMEMKDKAELTAALAEEVQAIESGVARVEPAKKEWSQEEQSKLEEALKTVPKDVPDRWAEIAKLVPGRSKGEVMIRVKTLMAEIQAKKNLAPVEWTEEERLVLVKAASKVYPPGTQPDPNLGDRWGQIAHYLQTHAHTTWKRGSKDIIAQVNAMKNVSSGLAAKKEADDFQSFEREKGKQRDKSDVPQPKKKK